MGFIYQEANAYGVEALVALERHYTPTEEKYCTAVTEAVRICDTYGIPERELVPQVRHIAAAEEYLLEHLSEDEETLQFLFTPLSGSNTCLAWFLVWDYVRPGGEKAYKYTGHTPQQRLRDIISAVGQYQEDPLPPPQQLDTICDLIDYMDLTRLPPADRWRLLTLYAHLEEYERTACRIVEQSAALLAQVMQTPETDQVLLSKEEALAKIATLTGGRSAEELIFSGETDLAVFPGESGELGILPRHAPLLTRVKPGTVRLKVPDQDRYELIYVSGGILEVQPTLITLLADTAIRATDLDEAKAIEAKNRAAEARKSRDANVDFAAAEAMLAQSIAQLKQKKSRF